MGAQKADLADVIAGARRRNPGAVARLTETQGRERQQIARGRHGVKQI